MSNTLTGLIPVLYEAMDVVSRELVGFIPAVARDSNAERAALNQTVRAFVAPAATVENSTPGVNAPDDGDATIGTLDMTIDKSKVSPIRFNGEEQRSLNNGGPGVNAIMRDRMTQSMRALTNLVEVDLAALHVNASRAYGTVATAFFNDTTKLGTLAQLRKILDDNGAPKSERSFVMGTTEGADLRSFQQLTSAADAGTTMTLRQGELLNIFDFSLRESAQVALFTPVGTNNGSAASTGAHALGATTITLASAGTGTIIPGDIITFASDTNKYVVVTGDADVSGGGTIVIAAPGLRVAQASGKAITTIAASRRNMGFSKNAIALATRVPAIPTEGDMAADSVIVTDPRSGLSFDFRLYKQYKQVRYELGIAWGVKCVKPEHLALGIA